MEATYSSVLRPRACPGSFSPAAYAVLILTVISCLCAGLCAVLHLKLGIRYTLVTVLSFYICLGHLASIVFEVDALTSCTGPKAPYTASSYTLVCEYLTILVTNGTSISIFFWCYTFLALVSGFGAEYSIGLLGTFRVLSVIIPLILMAVGIVLDLVWSDQNLAYAVVRDFFAFSLPIAALMIVLGAFRLIIKRRERRTDRIPNAISLSVCCRFVIAFLVLSVIAPFYLHDRISRVYLHPDRSRVDRQMMYTNESYIVAYAGLAFQGLGCFLVFGSTKIVGRRSCKKGVSGTHEVEEITNGSAEAC